MPKLHQVLAVESDLEGAYKRICEETRKVLGKPEMFTGMHRCFEPYEEDPSLRVPDEHQAMATTVMERLIYTSEAAAKYYDALLQKELTNQVAVADLVVDGTVIGERLPATFLLGMETRLRYLRDIYEAAPTLPVSRDWTPDPDRGKGVWSLTHPEEKLKTKKQFKSQILVEPTPEHPAQIEKWDEQVPIGVFVKKIWSGMLTSKEKSDILARIDALIRATKQARQQANTAEVNSANIGKTMMAYINKG